jgi:hypothetical protein
MEDVGQVAVYPCSPAASFVIGVILPGRWWDKLSGFKERFDEILEAISGNVVIGDVVGSESPGSDRSRDP